MKTHMDFFTVNIGRACPVAVGGDRLAAGFWRDPHFPNPHSSETFYQLQRVGVTHGRAGTGAWVEFRAFSLWPF